MKRCNLVVRRSNTRTIWRRVNAIWGPPSPFARTAIRVPRKPFLSFIVDFSATNNKFRVLARGNRTDWSQGMKRSSDRRVACVVEGRSAKMFNLEDVMDDPGWAHLMQEGSVFRGSEATRKNRVTVKPRGARGWGGRREREELRVIAERAVIGSAERFYDITSGTSFSC